jgi:hypothetical protein
MFLILLALGRSAMLRDPGTFWHTVVGQHILERGCLPHADEFTFTHAGRPWIAQQWLAEIGMAALHAVGGWDAQLAAACAILAVLWAIGFSRLLRGGMSWALAALIIMLAVGASSFHYHVRPHLVTLLLSAWLYGFLCDVDRGARPARSMAWIPLVMIVWVNLHGGAMGGIATLGLVVAGWIAAQAWHSPRCPFRTRMPGPRPPRGGAAAVGGVVLVLCCIAPLLNPYGVALPRVWFTLMSSSVLPGMIEEHGPPNPADPSFWMFVALAGVYLLTLWAGHPKRRRVTWFVPLAWMILGFCRIRHAPIFAAIAPLAIAAMLPGMPFIARLRAKGGDLFGRPVSAADRSRAIPAAALVALAGVLVIQVAAWRVPLIGSRWARLDPTVWPTDCLADLRSAMDAMPPGAPIINDMRLGGFLIYHEPRCRIMVDDRCELLGESGLWDYAQLCESEARLQKLIARHDVRLALVRRGTSLEEGLARRPEWRLVTQGQAARLFERPQAMPD